ncbi:DNA polymerase family B-domain-containing protein [Rhizophagus irregularis DAOM 181602=DAOM 197198]|nr:DNA polymerase family B-domain-containing protein [Rhizophagus irregularis DAOM 181602=DAOM 197198]
MTLSHDISEEKELYAIVSGKWNEMKKRLTPLKDKKKNMNLIIGLMAEYDSICFDYSCLDTKQYAFKVYMNIFYGMTGDSKSPFFLHEYIYTCKRRHLDTVGGSSLKSSIVATDNLGFEFDRANSKIPRINQSLPLLSSRYSQIQTSEKEINAFNCCLSILIKQRGNVYSQLYTGKQHAETCLKHVCLRIVQETASKHLNAGLCCLTTVGVINASWKTACWNVPTVP